MTTDIQHSEIVYAEMHGKEAKGTLHKVYSCATNGCKECSLAIASLNKKTN